MLGEGKTVAQACKWMDVTEVTYYRWKKEYDGATRDTIKRLLADQVSENRVRKDIAQGNF